MRANLLNAVDIVVERLIRDELLMDLDAREPVHGARTTTAQTFTLPAQVKWETKDQPQPEEGGPRDYSNGYVLLRPIDMDNIMGAGERLKRGDKITTLGTLTGLQIFITGQMPLGHHTSENGPTIIRYMFEDRSPTQQSRTF